MRSVHFTRRRVLALLLAVTLGPIAAAARQLPIIFVHGNGDSAALWTTTLWRFESNGYDRSRLFAPPYAEAIVAQ